MNVMNMKEMRRLALGLMIKKVAFELLIFIAGQPIKSTLQNSFSAVFDLLIFSLKTFERAPFLLLDFGIIRVDDDFGAADRDLSFGMNLGGV